MSIGKSTIVINLLASCTLSKLLCHIPCGLVNNCFVSGLKEKLFISRNRFTILQFEVRAFRFLQDSMSQILSAIDYVTDSSVSPSVWIFELSLVVLLWVILGCVS